MDFKNEDKKNRAVSLNEIGVGAAGSDFPSDKKKTKKKHTSRKYGNDFSGSYDKNDSDTARSGSEVDSDDSLEQETKRATQAGMRIIGYAPNTARRLLEKLIRRGFSRDAAESAVEALISTGLVDDRRELDGAVYCAVRKRLGPRRVEAELYRLGFERELIAEVDYDALGIDFTEGCRELLMKRGGVLDPKTRAYLASKGFTDDIMREAAKPQDD